MKHLIIISILLLSSPVIGNNHKGETLYGWGEYHNYKWMGFGDKETHPKYQCQVQYGEPNGLGLVIFPNGSKYVGEWENGEWNGQGTLTSPDGQKYVGGWKNEEISDRRDLFWQVIKFLSYISRTFNPVSISNHPLFEYYCRQSCDT